MDEKKTVIEWLNSVSYDDDPDYVPSEFALDFINFIKLVNGEEGEESPSPVMHMKMLDQLASKKKDVANLCYRGSSKTSVMAEYLFLYIAVFGEIPNFGKITIAIYVSDSMENGVKNMRKNLEYRRETSEFLMKYIPKARFTDNRYEFENLEGKKLIVKAYGAKTGVRGAKEQGKRVDLAIMDDLLSDDDARSPTVIASIEDTVYSAIDYALHPTRSKTIWSGTPFNQKDPLYKAIESGAWHVNVFPVCEKFPCTEEEFKGAWEERHTYEYVKSKYEKALKAGKLASFNQELMLRIISDEDRLIQDADIKWYKRDLLLKGMSAFNFYITTDFATSEKTSADYSVISVWALNNEGVWFWVDGICAKQLMSQNIKDLFRLVQQYKPQSVGIEISGQQGGFISWLQEEMLRRKVWFTIASAPKSNVLGIRPNINKLQRFMMIEPWFKSGLVYFPSEMRSSNIMGEFMEELSLITRSKFQSKHDDCIDTISMLGQMETWRPSEHTGLPEKGSAESSAFWDADIEYDSTAIDSYTV